MTHGVLSFFAEFTLSERSEPNGLRMTDKRGPIRLINAGNRHRHQRRRVFGWRRQNQVVWA
jgi:hypothetical protein